MENPEDDRLSLHSFTTRLGREESVRSEQPGQGEPDPEQKNRGATISLASIEFRVQQLHNRRLLLLKMKRCTKKEDHPSGRSMEERESPTFTCWLDGRLH